jgi:hypothetical protein
MSDVEVTTNEATIALWQTKVSDLFDSLYDPIMLGTWASWPKSEQLAFREMLDDAYSTFGIVFRQAFDTKVWEGWRNGTVSTDVESLRKERKDGDSEPKAPPTRAEVLAKAKARR